MSLIRAIWYIIDIKYESQDLVLLHSSSIVKKTNNLDNMTQEELVLYDY